MNFWEKKEKGKFPKGLPLSLRLSWAATGARHLGSRAGEAAFTITPETYISSLRGKRDALAA